MGAERDVILHQRAAELEQNRDSNLPSLYFPLLVSSLLVSPGASKLVLLLLPVTYSNKCSSNEPQEKTIVTAIRVIL
jgi:hypothetical protein